MNLLIEVTVVLSKERRRHPSNKNVLRNRSRLVMNCEIWVPSAAFKLEAFKSRLHQSESKFGLKVGQSKKTRKSVSLSSSLQVKQREPSGFRQPGDPTVQIEVAHQSLLEHAGWQLGPDKYRHSPERKLRNIFKTSSSYMQIRMTQSIFIPRIFVIFVYFIFYDCFPGRVIRKVPRFEIIKKFPSAEGLSYTTQFT